MFYSIQYLQDLSPEDKRLEREADQSPAPSAKVTNEKSHRSADFVNFKICRQTTLPCCPFRLRLTARRDTRQGSRPRNFATSQEVAEYFTDMLLPAPL